MPSMKSSAKDDRIVVGIDFGTTFSGLAFTYCGSPNALDEISVFKRHGGNDLTAEKVPSELIYVKLNESSCKRDSSGNPVTAAKKSEPVINWGYNIRPEQRRIHCLKLLLDPQQELPNYASRQVLEDQLKECGKTALQATSDYLSTLYKTSHGALVKRFGRNMVASTKVDIVMTVPAVWSDDAKEATLKAAERAGLGSNIHMISEPEAAATYALKYMESHSLVTGDNFIVCDAGGGTIDLISYEISSLSPLRIKESAPGTGALAGSVFLNMRFESLIRKRMGSLAFEKILAKKPDSWGIALQHFEDYVKRNFDPSNGTVKFKVPFPGVANNPQADIKLGFISLSTGELEDIFEPIVNSVIELVEKQRNVLAGFRRNAKALILVGGFGQSEYLYKELKNRFADEDPPPLYSEGQDSEPPKPDPSRFVIMRPANAWTAVVRGAVMSGVDDSKLVLSRKARHHYGLLCSEHFNPDKHSYSDRFWNRIPEHFSANNQIHWYIKKGQTLQSGTPIMLDVALNKDDHKPRATRNDTWKIVVSDEPSAPQTFVPDHLTRVLCKLSDGAEHAKNRIWTNCRSSTGKMYQSLPQKIGMEVQSGRLLFDCRIDGKVVSKVLANFE